MEGMQQMLDKFQEDELNKQQSEDQAREQERVSLDNHIKSSPFLLTLQFLEAEDILKMVCLSKHLRSSFCVN